MTARKDDGGKPRLELIPPEALVGMGNVFRYGAEKYATRNFELGMDWSRLHGAALRHLTAWAAGQGNDPETSFSHLHHALCSIAMLTCMVERGIGKDDRRHPEDPRPSVLAKVLGIEEVEARLRGEHRGNPGPCGTVHIPDESGECPHWCNACRLEREARDRFERRLEESRAHGMGCGCAPCEDRRRGMTPEAIAHREGLCGYLCPICPPGSGDPPRAFRCIPVLGDPALDEE